MSADIDPSPSADNVPQRLPFATVLSDELEAIWGRRPSIEMVAVQHRDHHMDPPEHSEATLNRIIHRGDAGPLSAVCLSGGGIRSATFALGVLEGLAAYGVLDKFSYLSTVSGGGYIGSWLTAWIHRRAREHQAKAHSKTHVTSEFASMPGAVPPPIDSADDASGNASATGDVPTAGGERGRRPRLKQALSDLASKIRRHPTIEVPPLSDEDIRFAVTHVCKALAGRDLEGVDSPATDPIGKHKRGVAAEAAPIVQLRRFSNYLAPQAGLLSADSWVLIATILRNMILNWLVLIPVIMGALALPRTFAAAVFAAPVLRDRPIPGSFEVPLYNALYAYGFTARTFAGSLLIVLGFVLCAWTVGFVSWKRVVRLPETPDDPMQRAGQWQILAAAVLPLCTAAVLLSIGWAWAHLTPGGSDAVSRDMLETMAFGALLMLAGWSGHFFYRVRHDGDVNQEAVPQDLNGYSGELAAYVGCGAAGGFLLRLAAHPFDGVSLAARPIDALVYTTVAAPIFIFSFLLAATIFVGVASRQMSEMDREWWSRFGAWSMIVSVGWLAVCSVVLLAPHWLADKVLAPVAAALTAGTGLFTILAGLSRHTVFKAVTQAAFPSGESAKDKAPSAGHRWAGRLLKIALPTFVVLFAITLSLLTDLLIAVTYARRDLAFPGLVDEYLKSGGHLTLAVARSNFPAALALIVFGVIMSRGISVNKFSLHAMYRNRLIRAYLGASRGTRRNPDRFIGFDPKDDLPLCETKSESRGGRPLLHVINVALNLVAGGELAWQERKAESMTVTALHAGTPRLGFRRANEYGGSSHPGRGESSHAITLGTAMAISGAAASPNMGYHSSPTLTFLMTLFNARLGWWLGNPGRAGDETCRLDSPRSSLKPLFDEAFGRTDEHHSYVYLSDGGHFENLGLYEMVRRRCRFILVVDAGADPDCEFEDLSAAVRKIRSDLGIPIDLGTSAERQIFARSNTEKHQDGKIAIRGAIHYSAIDGAVDDGELIYIKPAYYGMAEPLDVVHYARNHEPFPHETTADQFFSESQFESYRAMGRLAVDQLWGRRRPDGSDRQIADFLASVDQYVPRATPNGTTHSSC